MISPEAYIETRKQIVAGVGNKNAKILIVGECPGRKEEEEREPFADAGGRLLRSLLFKAQITWSDCYVTTVVKERPKGSNIDNFIKLSNKYPKINDENYEKYVEYLKEEINEIQPNVVLAVGNVALFALTGERGITSWRGSILESSLIPGLKVIPTIHPSSALRNYLYQYYIFNDIQLLKEESEFSYIADLPYIYYTDPTYEQIMHYLEQCKDSALLGFDIEVGGYKDGLSEVSCISFSKDKESSMSIPFTRGGQPRWSADNELKIWNEIADLLEDASQPKVAQNKFFDTHFLFRRYGIVTRNCHDSMIAQAILRPDFPKGLDFICSMYTKIGYYKADGKEFFGGRGNEEQFWLYNAKDSMVLTVAFPELRKKLGEAHLWETYMYQNKLVESLVFMSEHGIAIDAEGLEKIAGEAGEKLEEIEQLLNDLAGREINPRSPKQLKEYFYGPRKDGNLGLPAYKNRSTGKPTTNEEALLRLSRPIQKREAVPEAQLLLEHRKLAKLKSTYYEMNYDEDNRIRSSMNPVGTRFGRLSSSENIFGTGTNMQNQPYAMKEFFLADKNHPITGEDYIAYEMDLGQAENRIVAYVAPEPKLIQAFENEIDIHSRTASYIFGIPEDEISSEEQSAPEFGNGEQSQRYWGKKANHAFNYGQGPKAFSMQMSISIAEARKIYNAYHNAYPGIRKYHNMVKQQLQKDRTLTNLFGRRYTFLDRWDYNLWNEGYSFIPQSSIADIINRWGLIPVYEQLDDVVLLNQVHDSIVFQISTKIPYSEHAELILRIRDWLSQPLTWNGREFRIPCDLKILPVNLMKGKEITLKDNLWKEDLTKEIVKEVKSQIG